MQLLAIQIPVSFVFLRPLQRIQNGIMSFSWFLSKSGTFSDLMPLSHSTEEVIHY